MTSLRESLLWGRIKSADDLPVEPSHQVKVFLCCSSTDFDEERDAIISRVISNVREEARSKYGLEFNYVDLRFGLQLPGEMDFKNKELRLKELLRCQGRSAGINFLLLLGQKYGSKSPPQLILSEVYEQIEAALLNSKSRKARNVHLMERWYVKDDNSIPAVHVLCQPTAKDEDERRDIWKEDKQLLCHVLMFGVELCCKEGSLPIEALRSYFVSEFENEVKHGLMDSGKTGALVFEREITDIANYVDEERVTAFTELEWSRKEENWKISEETRQALEALKLDVITKNVDRSSIRKYSVLWRYDTGIHPVLHKEYIDEVCSDIKEQLLSRVADAAAVFEARRIELPPLYNEILIHWRKVLAKGYECQGRERELEILLNYLEDRQNNEFFTIYGDMGSGKTCLLSKALLEIHAASRLSAETIVIVRFLSLTQDSSNLRDLLYSICNQLASCLYGTNFSIPTEFQELQKYFWHLIDNIPRKRSLILILDSVHSLSDRECYTLSWLPHKLPENVKIVISSLSHEHGIITRIKTEIINNLDNCLEVRPLSEESAMKLLLRLLQQHCICVTNDQASILRNALKKCSLPLYIKMIFEEVKQWRSFDRIDEDILGHNCQSYLDGFFNRLEQAYGHIVVKHALAYLTASKTGLSDGEIEDLLSLDEIVMSFVFKGFTPVIRRCPSYTWAALRSDLEPFLVMKNNDGYDVSYWFHQMITRYVESRYLADEGFRQRVHHLISDYYLGTWYGRPVAYLDASGSQVQADRYVLPQPLTYTNYMGKVCYNKRKYDQVPRHLYLAKRLDQLNDNVLFNYEWLYNKMKTLSLQHILSDLSLNMSVEVLLLEEALRAAQSIINGDMKSMATELIGRLLPYYHTHQNITKLIQQCDTKGLVHCSMLPVFPYHQVPGSPLRSKLDYVSPIDGSWLASDGRHLLLKSDNSHLVRLFDVTTGEYKHDVFTSYGRLHVSLDGKYLIIVDNEIEKSIKVHNAADGLFRGQFIPLRAMGLRDIKKYSLGEINVSYNYIAALITTDDTNLCIGSLTDVSSMKIIRLDGKASIVQIAPNENYVLCNVGLNVLAFSLITYTQICLTQLEYIPRNIAVTSDSTKIFYTDDKSKILTVSYMSSEGYTQMVSKIILTRYFDKDSVEQIKLSNSEDKILARGKANIVVYNLMEDKVDLHIQKPLSMNSESCLPKPSQLTPIAYTEALFNSNDDKVVVSLFRSIQIWDIKGQGQSKVITTPIGTISKIYVSPINDLLITTQLDSTSVHVWDSYQNTSKVATMTDKLTSPIDNIVATENGSVCFASASQSNQVAVIDMASGTLTSLLTHECKVEDMKAVPDGSFLFVTVEAAKSESCNKIWSVKERKLVKEYGGQSRSLACALRKSSILIDIRQPEAKYKSPYSINIFKFHQDSFTETSYEFMINHAISKPFITADDTYMVLLSADEYIEKKAMYVNPSICTIYLKGRYMHNIIGMKELSPFLDSRHLIELAPIHHSPSQIIAIYKTKRHLAGDDSISRLGYYGYAYIELATSVVVRYNDNFMPDSLSLRSITLNNSGTQCFNSELGAVFDMKSGLQLTSINNRKSDISLLNNGNVVIYYHGPYLLAERLQDGKVLARCNTHADICTIRSCKDEKTVLIGCVDGSVLSYTLIDARDEHEADQIVRKLPSRINRPETYQPQENMSQTKQELAISPPRSSSCRPRLAHSADPSYQSDRDRLKRIRPIYRAISPAKSLMNYTSPPLSASSSYNRSQTCNVM